MGPILARRGASVLAVLGVLISSVMPAGADGARKKAGGVVNYVIINFLLATADYESARAVQRPGACRESNPLFSSYPGRVRFYGEGLAIDAGPELVGWLLHRKHVRLWQAPFAVVTAWHAEGIVSNLRCAGAHP
ncbi:MAG TPA: hypothetical protein VJP83_10985 [Terriglobales bacterium]|nr:hypothetical protein [Terriglobales bacterium]